MTDIISPGFINDVLNIDSGISTLATPISFASLLNGINNYKNFDLSNRGWVSATDPLFTNLFIYAPASYNQSGGNYIPFQMCQSAILPARSIVNGSYQLRGGKITYPTGFEVGDFQVTFFENQQLQVSGYFNAWLNATVALGGSDYALPSQYKANQFFIINAAEGISNGTALGQLINSVLPADFINALSAINFAGIVMLIGTYPKNVAFESRFENPPNVNAQTINVTFNCDEMVLIPFSTDLTSVFDILGLNRSGSFGAVTNFGLGNVFNPFSIGF